MSEHQEIRGPEQLELLEADHFGPVKSVGLAKKRPVRRHRLLRVKSARLGLEGFTPGTDFEVMTNGEFSILDALLVLLERLDRPADLVVSTWSIGLYDVEVVNKLLAEGRLRSARFIFDVSFKNNIGSRGYAGQLMGLFGEDRIRTTRTHAKFFLLHDGDEGYSLTSTANLNENKRLELMYFSDDPVRLRWYLDLVDEIFAEVEEGWNPDHGAPSLASIDPTTSAVSMGTGRVTVGQVRVDGWKPTVENEGAGIRAGKARVGHGGA